MEKRKIVTLVGFIAGSLILFFAIFFTVAHFTFQYYEGEKVFSKSGLSISLTRDFDGLDIKNNLIDVIRDRKSSRVYTQENMTFFKTDEGIEMQVGNYMYHTDVKSISENDYLKIDVIDKVVHYSMETYKVKFTNRSNYTVVVADGEETDEVILILPKESRQSGDLDNIVLRENESCTIKFEFPKFVDDGDKSQKLAFPAIRVMEKLI